MIPTIIIGAVIGIAFILVIAREIKNKKSGKGGCSCGCGGCAMKDACHSKK